MEGANSAFRFRGERGTREAFCGRSGGDNELLVAKLVDHNQKTEGCAKILFPRSALVHVGGWTRRVGNEERGFLHTS